MNNSDGDTVFLTTTQVRARYGGRSHMWVERLLTNDPLFPKPIFLGRLRYWKITELVAWERARAAEGRQGRAA